MNRLMGAALALAVGMGGAHAEDAPKAPSTEKLVALATAENAEAQYLLGMLDLSSGRAKAKPEQAAAWLRKASDKGHAGAKAVLASLYLKGSGVGKDEAEAARLLREAAEAGNADAQVNLAQLLHEGRGVARDDGAAAGWLEKAVAQGKPEAMVDLARLYQAGDGVAKDDGRAVALLRKAAGQGGPAAQTQLALALLRDKDHAREGADWLRTAADKGYAPAQFNLGVLYLSGSGLDRDPVQAVKWVSVAGANGDSDMREKADKLLKGLAPSVGPTTMNDGLAAARQYLLIRQN